MPGMVEPRRGRLPFRGHAFVEDAKLAYYLDERHRHIPGSKVKLVRDVLGFRDPAALRSALIAHARNNEATALPDQGHGARYNVSGPMIGPRGAIASHFSTCNVGGLKYGHSAFLSCN